MNWQRTAAHRPTPLRLVGDRERYARASDLVTFDHLPACPSCGDLAHPAATVCEACGAHLFPQSNVPNRTSLPGARPGTSHKGA